MTWPGSRRGAHRARGRRLDGRDARERGDPRCNSRRSFELPPARSPRPSRRAPALGNERSLAGDARPVRFACGLSSACSGGANALIVAASWILSGELDAVVAGGTDGLCRLTFSGFNALAAIDPEPCRPFDARRRGLNLGEGAGLLGPRAGRPRPSARGAAAGGARRLVIAAEAHHITNPEQRGATAARVMRAALARAGLAPSQIDYVNAHGTGTPLNDPMEAAAIAHGAGSGDVGRVPVSSSKGQIGHTLAAAGAVEAAITALVLARQRSSPLPGSARSTPPARASCTCPARGVRRAPGGDDERLRVRRIGQRARAHRAGARAAPCGDGADGDRVVVTAAATFTPRGAPAARGVELQVLAPGPGASRSPRSIRSWSWTARGVWIDSRGSAPSSSARDRGSDRALASAGSAPVGAILGTNFGSIDASAAFMHRSSRRAPARRARPSFRTSCRALPVGHVSIYLGLRGPVFAAVELGTTGECAVMQAAELIAAGEADAMAAGDVEEANGVVEGCLVRALCTDCRGRGREARRRGGCGRPRGRGVRAGAGRRCGWRASLTS